MQERTRPAFSPDEVPVAAWAELGERLRASGLSVSSLAEAERILPSRHDALRLPLVLRALRRAGSSSAVLLRLFVYDDSVDEDAIVAVLGRALVDELRRSGALGASASGLASVVRITPFEDLLIASDPTHASDPVIPPGPTTLHLARCMAERLDGRSVLDLGAGPGSLAVLAARRGAGAVVATDLSARALAYTRATAAMSAVTLELLEGDLAAPVAGRVFDLVVCQPPFVPQPRAVGQTTYLHGGGRGDELAWRVLEALPALLAPGGAAILRVDLPGPPEEVAALLTRRLPLSGIAFLARGLAADELAMAYAAAHHRTYDDSVAREAAAYADHFEEQGIPCVTAALLVLWRDATARRLVRVVPSLAGVDARAVARARAALEASGSAAATLLAGTARPSKGARLRTTTDLDAHESSYVLETPGELPCEISEPVALLVDVLSQGATVSEAAESLARATDASLEEAEQLTVGFVRDAIRGGLLHPEPRDEPE